MTRSRASAKAAGARFERLIADALAQHVDDRIDRRVKTGAADKGDIAGLRLSDGSKIVAELKDYGGALKVGPWLNEAAKERINDDALAAIVVAKRRGTTNPLDQIVFCTLADFIAIVTHQRPEETSK